MLSSGDGAATNIQFEAVGAFQTKNPVTLALFPAAWFLLLPA